ncbi:hypothetical protein WCT84_06310 [Pectobacterium brasiliense]|uniref:hypothetical protein n=1 Tax=Pectobacterium brasiliense TaxID=180957 RepID=UPI0030170162
MEIKSVSYEWKELIKTDVSTHFRVVCKIITVAGLEVTGGSYSVVNKAPLGIISSFMDDVQMAEASAYQQANNALFKIVGERIPDRFEPIPPMSTL